VKKTDDIVADGVNVEDREGLRERRKGDWGKRKRLRKERTDAVSSR